WLFGIEPELAAGLGERVRYDVRPSDEEVNELLATCTAFVQTSRHEGFCLPVLEAMSAGAPVVCTDADGNRDFCVDGENCLMPTVSVALKVRTWRFLSAARNFVESRSSTISLPLTFSDSANRPRRLRCRRLAVLRATVSVTFALHEPSHVIRSFVDPLRAF